MAVGERVGMGVGNATRKDSALGCVWLAGIWLACMLIIIGFWAAVAWGLTALLSLA